MFEGNKIILMTLDLIYEDGVCVKASDCPCEHHSMLYPSGHVIQEDCNNWSDTILSYALHTWMPEEILMLVFVWYWTYSMYLYLFLHLFQHMF